MSQHANLSPERWSTFSLDQQILMIGNEMNRAKTSINFGDIPRLRLSYARILLFTPVAAEQIPFVLD